MTFTPRHVWLDLARGASALAVAASHLRLVAMCGYADLPAPTPLQAVFYLFSGLSSQAVMVFFSLSGMLVGGSVLRGGEGFRFEDYLLARLVRLWVPLVPALLFTLLVDTVTLHLAPQVADGAFHPRWTSGPLPGTYSTSPTTFLGNVTFVNTILVPSFGTNGPLWTLACEFWYYVSFPLLARAAGLVGRRGAWWPRAAAGVLGMTVLAAMPAGMALGFGVWMMGVGVAVVVQRVPGPPRVVTTVAAVCVFALSLVYSKLDYLRFVLPVPYQYVVGLAFAWLAVQLVRLPPPGRVLSRLATTTADLSYSFYLTHFPLTICLAVWRFADGPRQAGAADVAEYVGWLAAQVGVGWLFWFAFERHSNRVRTWVFRWREKWCG
jgi:peptidoglycan/LPS O-acetylase OafA/YrhL